MYPERLPDSKKKYVFSEQEVFEREYDLVRGFPQRRFSDDMHVQEFWEINIVTCGRGMHYIENSRVAARRGDVFIVPDGVRHGWRGVDEFNVYHFLLSYRFMEKYMADLQLLPCFFEMFSAEPLMRAAGAEPLHLQLSEEQLGMMECLMEQLRQLDKKYSAAISVRRCATALLLITELCENYSNNKGAQLQEGTAEDAAFMNALSFIHEHYDEKLTIARLAQIAHLSRSAFIRRFRQVCKATPADYILKRRIEGARMLLRSTSLSEAVIAQRTGFYDSSHFIRVFTAETGITPGKYRRT